MNVTVLSGRVLGTWSVAAELFQRAVDYRVVSPRLILEIVRVVLTESRVPPPVEEERREPMESTHVGGVGATAGRSGGSILAFRWPKGCRKR